LFGKKGNRDADLEAEREIGESVSEREIGVRLA
jgi:hypothetical protein